MRVKLKSSKSYPNDLLRQKREKVEQQQQSGQEQKQHQPHQEQQHQQKQPIQQQQPKQQIHTKNNLLQKPQAKQPEQKQKEEKNSKLKVKIEEGDNSSSGVSSDQEVTVIHTSLEKTLKELSNKRDMNITTTSKTTNPMSGAYTNKSTEVVNRKSIILPPLSNVTKKISSTMNAEIQNKSINNTTNDNEDDVLDSPSPPPKGFQRHNSLTRKQAATIAMSRSLNTRNIVSLVQLPPPIEGDSDTELPHGTSKSANAMVVPPPLPYSKNFDVSPSAENINVVLAPPVEFCDCTNANITKIMNNNNAAGLIAENNGMVTVASNNNNNSRSVRIVGAVPKISRLHIH